MEADHREAAADPQRRQRPFEAPAQFVEFAVDADADSLEGAGGGMFAAALAIGRALVAGRGGSDDLREPGGAGDGCPAPFADDGRGDAPGMALFAIAENRLGDFVLGGAVEPLGGADSAARVHAHVERAIAAETEAPVLVLKLRRGQAEIENHAVDAAGEAAVFDFGAQVTEAAVDNAEPGLGGAHFARGGNRLWVPVERQQPTGGAEALENRRAVAAAAEGRVDVSSVLPHVQCLHDCRPHDRMMFGRAIHQLSIPSGRC